LSGGQNNQVNQFLQQENESTLIKNGNLDIIGAVQKDLGYTQKGSTIGSSPIQFITEYSKGTTGTVYQLMETGGNAYRLTAGAWVIETGNGAGISNSNADVDTEVFFDRLWHVDGVAGNRFFDGTTWTLGEGSSYMDRIPLVALIREWRESLF